MAEKKDTDQIEQLKEHKASIWRRLYFALIGTLGATIIGIIVITLMRWIFDILDNGITDIQSIGYWWMLFIIGFLISLAYVLIKPAFDRRKLLTTLIFYWKHKLEKNNKAKPTGYEIEIMEEQLIKRMKVAAWFDREVWEAEFGIEKYPESIFDLVDNYWIYFDDLASRARSNPKN